MVLQHGTRRIPESDCTIFQESPDRRDPRPPPVRQDDAGARPYRNARQRGIRRRRSWRRRTGALLRPRRPRASQPADRPQACPGIAGRPDRHRRDTAPSGAVSPAPGADRPGPAEAAVPDPRQRVTRSDTPVLRDARRSNHLSGTPAVHRIRNRRPEPPLAARRFSPRIPGEHRLRQHHLAQGLRHDVPGAGSAGIGHRLCRRHHAPVLDDGCPLARQHSQCVGIRPFTRCLVTDHQALSRHPRRHVHHPHASTLVRKHAQATGQVAQDPVPRQRHPSRAAQPAGPGQPARPSQDRRFVGRVRIGAGHPDAPGRTPASASSGRRTATPSWTC